MKSNICHIEIPADNLGTLQQFYNQVFEWDFEKIPGDFEYFNVKHGDEKPMVGMMHRENPEQTPLFYVCVDSIDAALERARTQEATVLVPKTAVNGYGWFAVLTDPQQNSFGIWESNENAS